MKNSYTLRITFEDYEFKCQFFKELKERIMEANNFKNEDEVKNLSFVFDEMLEVEGRYIF